MEGPLAWGSGPLRPGRSNFPVHNLSFPTCKMTGLSGACSPRAEILQTFPENCPQALPGAQRALIRSWSYHFYTLILSGQHHFNDRPLWGGSYTH